MQAIRTPQNKAEPIIDNTPETPFLSPLQTYIHNNCEHCDFWKTKCRLDDQNGMTRMELCISIYTHQVPADFGEILKQAQKQSLTMPEAKDFKEIQEAEPHDDA